MTSPTTIDRRLYEARRSRRSGYRVMLFRPSGRYPAAAICAPGGLFFADGEIAFSVTRGTPWPEGLPYSEVNWLLPGDIQLLGSIVLTEDFDGGPRCVF